MSFTHFLPAPSWAKSSVFHSHLRKPYSLALPFYSAVKNSRASSYDTLVELFASFENFLGRLRIYTGIPPTPVLTDLLVKIIAELLYTLALATKHVKRGRFKKFVKNIRRENDIGVALRRLDRLTSDEGRATAAQTLEVVYNLVQHRRVILDDTDGNNPAAGISHSLESTQEIVSKWELRGQRGKLMLQQDAKQSSLACNFFFLRSSVLRQRPGPRTAW